VCSSDLDSLVADGAITLLVPNDKRGIFTVINNSAFAVTVDIVGNSPVVGVTVSAGATKILNTDGSTIAESA